MYRLNIFKKKNTFLKESGQALIEFALVFPLFLLILFAIIDFGWIGYQKASFEYGYMQASWYVSADDLNDYDTLENTPSKKTYIGSVVADVLREDLEDSSIGIIPTNLSVRNARATLYNEKGSFSVPGPSGKADNEAEGITRYMDVSASIVYEVQSLTFLGKTLFGDNFSFKKDLDRTRVVRRQTRSE